MNRLALDIETYRNSRAYEYTDNMKIKPDSRVKDLVKIEAAIAAKRAKLGELHALTWWTGKVISVALADVDGLDSDSVCFYGHDEAEVLVELAEYLDEKSTNGLWLIGKNSKTFDFPFLIGRYMANKIKVPPQLKRRDGLYDVDDFFGYGSMANQKGRLDAYLHGLGLQLKGMDGSMVGALYERIMAEEEGWQRLIDYNIEDAIGTAKVAKAYWNE